MRRLRPIPVLGLFAIVCSAQQTNVTDIGPVTLADPSDETIFFPDSTAAAGLAGVFTDGNTHTGGAAWVDYNGDLLPDLFVTNGGGLQHFLFRNDGGGTFTDVSSLVPKPDIELEDSGVLFADLENDGDYDIFVAVDNPATVIVSAPVNPPEGGPNLLYVNQGDGTFAESAASYGVVHPLGRRTSCAGFADYDNDGFIDLYLGSWTPYGLPLGVHDDYNRLLHNDGDGTFTETTSALGADGLGLDALGLLWFDIDFDRYPDLYIGNVASLNSPPAFIPIDIFYRNSGGVAFTDDVSSYPYLGNDAYADMGMDVGDTDNDGDWDFYITDIFDDPPMPQGNVYYRTDPGFILGENDAGNGRVSADSSWGCNFIDVDLDGWVDLWVGALHTYDTSYVYKNDKTGRFDETSQPLMQGVESRGGACADYDGDGDIDIVMTMMGQDLKLFRNESGREGSWLELKLYGTQTNRGAIGTVVKVTANGMTQMRRVSGGDSAHSQSDAILHFGVPGATLADVTVEWPSGTDQTFLQVPLDDLILVDEDQGILTENVTDDGSSWDPTTASLRVRVKSNYGGRTELSVPGLGDLRFDAASGTHRAVVHGLTRAPGPLQITADRGGRWTLPIGAKRRR